MANTQPSNAGDGDDHDVDLLAMWPRLARLSTVLNRGHLFERAVEGTGVALERPAISLLVVLQTAGTPLRIGEIAKRMQVVGPHVTRQVQGLERRGLTRRVADPHDQRARLIELTPEGAAVAGRYLQTVLGWFNAALAGWPAQDRQTFGRLLGRFADDLTARLAALDDEDPAAT
jgi:DNA-binding MarR family transcriptional regulator